MWRNAILSVLLVATGVAGGGEERDVDRSAPSTTGDPHDWQRVLVDLRDQADLDALLRRGLAEGWTRRQAARATRDALEQVAFRGQSALIPVLDALAERGLVADYRPLRIRSRFVVVARPAALSELAADPRVAAVIPEYDSLRDARHGASRVDRPPVAALPIPPGDSWGVDALGLRELWSRGIDGRGIVIGILDSGVDGAHSALAGNRRSRRFWFDPSGEWAEPADTGWHGTQVLASALGRLPSGRSLGAAPRARWVAALSNRANGYNNVGMSLAADWMLFEGRPDVLLAPWGHGPGSCDPRDLPLIAAFRAAGCLPVFAAGNGGPGPSSAQSPASLSGLPPDGSGPLAIGAADRNGAVVEASARGPSPCGDRPAFPDLVAPGWLLPVPDAEGGEALTLASGTSMAAGWVGGVAALVLQVAPDLPVPELERLLRDSAIDLAPPGPDPDTGFGLVDPRAAVEAARRRIDRTER